MFDAMAPTLTEKYDGGAHEEEIHKESLRHVRKSP